MRNHFVTLAMMTAGCFATSQADVYFSTDFATGMGSDISTSFTGEQVNVKEGYKQNVGDTWTVLEAGSKGKAAVCATYVGNGNVISERVMTLPEFKVVDDGAILRWQSRSFIRKFREQYRVDVINLDNNESKTVFSTESEPNYWNWHCVGLDEFKGAKVKVSFVCTSVNSYLLAVDDIFAGVPEDVMVDAKVTSPVFQAVREDSFVEGHLVNLGSEPGFKTLSVEVGGKSVGTMPIDNAIATGTGLDFKIDVTLAQDTKHDYKLVITDASGKKSEIASGILYLSNFRRNHVVDEFTGNWCTNCPGGAVELEKLEQSMGEQIIPVAAHVSQSTAAPDPMEMYGYPQHLHCFGAPFFVLDKNSANGMPQSSVNKEEFQTQLFMPTTVKFEITGAKYDKENSILNVDYAMAFSEDTDNTNDRYRLGFQWTYTAYEPDNLDYDQNNGQQTAASAEQFYFLPNTVPAQLMVYDHVNATGEEAFFGVEGYMNFKFKAFEDITGNVDIDLPENVSDKNRGRLVMFIVDAMSGLVYKPSSAQFQPENVYLMKNVDAIYLSDAEGGSLEEFPDQKYNPGNLVVSAIPDVDSNGVPEYFDLQGRRVVNPAHGIYLERRGNKVGKKIVK